MRMIGETYEKDDSNSEAWPDRTVVHIRSLDRNPVDDKTNAERVTLSCGHEVISTFDDGETPVPLRAVMRCRTCYVKGGK